MRKILLQWVPVGVLSLIGWGVGVMPGNTSWIPSVTIWGIALLWLIGAFIYWFKNRHKPQIEQAEQSLVLTPHTYAIGLSGMTGYPDKPDNAYWLCLEVTVHPSSKPIDTLDLLIGSETIPANDWPGKNVAAFSIYFKVTDWKWKGEIQVELQACIQGAVHSSGRIPIDFNVEPGGSHRI